jgi:hypothetical protein
MNGTIGSKQNFPRQPDITGIIFDQENFYWHASPLSALMVPGCRRERIVGCHRNDFGSGFDCDAPSSKVNNHE